jgi:hypothetical protein
VIAAKTLKNAFSRMTKMKWCMLPPTPMDITTMTEVFGVRVVMMVADKFNLNRGDIKWRYEQRNQ